MGVTVVVVAVVGVVAVGVVVAEKVNFVVVVVVDEVAACFVVSVVGIAYMIDFDAGNQKRLVLVVADTD